MAYIACAPTSSDGAINELLQGWGRDIAAARQSMGLSQPACANCLFLKVETVAGIENGDARIGLGAFVTVLWALGLVENLDGPLAPVEVEERPTLFPAIFHDWEISRMPVPYDAVDGNEGPTTLSAPGWPSELWALQEAVAFAPENPNDQSSRPEGFLSEEPACSELAPETVECLPGNEEQGFGSQFTSWALACEEDETEFLQVASSANQSVNREEGEVGKIRATANMEPVPSLSFRNSSNSNNPNQSLWSALRQIFQSGKEQILR